MRRVLITIGALLAAAGIGALAASLAGGDPAPAPFVTDPDRELDALPVERVGAPPADARQARGSRGGRGEQLEFFQTQPLEIAAGTEEGATLSCPKAYKAAGGYYRTGQEGTFLGLTAPEISDRPTEPEPDAPSPSKRNWEITIFNTTGASDQFILGVSCLRKRR